MKKLIVLGTALIASVNLFATPASEALDKLHGNLKDRQVQEKLKRNEILPLFVNEVEAFKSQKSKNILLQNAKDSINKHNNYVAYYNAAVVAFTDSSYQGNDVKWNMTATDKENVVNWTTKALELSKNKQAPDMYLLRARAREIFYSNQMNRPEPSLIDENWVKNHKALARPIAADFEKVYEINPTLGTNYADMLATLYRGLGNTAKADKYQRIANAESKRVQAETEAYNQKLNQNLKNEMKHSASAANTKGAKKGNIPSHPRAGFNGAIWPCK